MTNTDEGNIECPYTSTFLRPNWVLLQKCNFGLPAGNQTCNPMNLVQCSANEAMESVAESMAMSSLFMK